MTMVHPALALLCPIKVSHDQLTAASPCPSYDQALQDKGVLGPTLKSVCPLILRSVYAATSGRLMQARTDLLLVIVEQLQKEGVLYTLPPYQDGNSGGRYLPEDGDPNVQPQNVKNNL